MGVVELFHTLCMNFVERLLLRKNFMVHVIIITDKYTKAVRLVVGKKSDSADDFASRFCYEVYLT